MPFQHGRWVLNAHATKRRSVVIARDRGHESVRCLKNGHRRNNGELGTDVEHSDDHRHRRKIDRPRFGWLEERKLLSGLEPLGVDPSAQCPDLTGA
jgi:hypothetical protein